MLSRRTLLLAFLALPGMAAGQSSPSAPSPSASSTSASSPEPAALVRQIFDAYAKDNIPRVPWSPAVAARMKRADISADPILQAQDIDMKGFVIKDISRGTDRAVVEVNFTSFNRKMRSQFDFRLVDGKWTIGNYRILAGVEFVPTDFRKELKLPPLN